MHKCISSTLLINSRKNQTEKQPVVLCMFMCSAFLLVIHGAPTAPLTVCEGIVGVKGGCWRWAPRFQAVSHTLLIGSYRSPENNKNTSFCLHHSHLSGFTCKQQLLFHYNDIILIGAATENLHLLILGIIIRQYRVILTWMVKGKEQLDWPVG